ncbi:MAG TPA: substrate-binding domain-containing protein [Bacteroidales bacterium]|nr:substrate-binding domain-containing protein [Bacteroidales bacterium]HOH84917.1 substrate-binding domain-containing protein [Bacteroidales bacterium]
MKKTVFFLCFAAILFASCGPGKQKDDKTTADADRAGVSGMINVDGDGILYPLMNKWKQEFAKEFSEVKIGIKTGNTGSGLKRLAAGELQMVMAARELSETEKQSGFWAVPVAKDVVLPVISFDNSNLQKIVFTGVTKEKMASAFTGKISSWGQLLQQPSKDPVELYAMNDSADISLFWAGFLGVDAGNIKGNKVSGENEMAMKVAANKNALGYCSMTYVFDITTGFKKKNLYVLPIDLNANKMADDNELVFDKLDDIKSAVSSGKYPSPPSRKLYLVCKTKPSDKATVSFIKWILTVGQNHCGPFGFINLSTEEAAGYLKQLE